MGGEGSALAQGFYWHAEKLMWGYEGVEKNHEEAFKLANDALQAATTAGDELLIGIANSLMGILWEAAGDCAGCADCASIAAEADTASFFSRLCSSSRGLFRFVFS